ncbi:hypothetical protein ACOSP7_028565 [Xanthoceras sorbifolium]
MFADGSGSNLFLFEEENTTLDTLTALVPQDPRKPAAYKRVTEEFLLKFKLAHNSSGVLQHLAEHGTMAADQGDLGNESSFSIRHHNEGVEFRLILQWNFNNRKFIFSTAGELLTVRFRRLYPIWLSSNFPLSSTVQFSPSVMESVLVNHSDLDFEMLQGDLASRDICHGCLLSSFSFFNFLRG